MDEPRKTALDKICPVVLRRHGGEQEILAFRHPLAGRQLVKGTIEPGENLEAAARRELYEESGIDKAVVVRCLGALKAGDTHMIWHVVLCRAGELPDHWLHHCEDDGGHDFDFFWHPLGHQAGDDWHPSFRQALSFIRAVVIG